MGELTAAMVDVPVAGFVDHVHVVGEEVRWLS
jgi:hypothetical protein